jgi:hypothetical protein
MGAIHPDITVIHARNLPPRRDRVSAQGRLAGLEPGKWRWFSAAASCFRFTAAAIRKAWICMFRRPRRIALARPCPFLALPWKPAERQRRR